MRSAKALDDISRPDREPGSGVSKRPGPILYQTIKEASHAGIIEA